jgi:hypothetical protein
VVKGVTQVQPIISHHLLRVAGRPFLVLLPCRGGHRAQASAWGPASFHAAGRPGGQPPGLVPLPHRGAACRGSSCSASAWRDLARPQRACLLVHAVARTCLNSVQGGLYAAGVFGVRAEVGVGSLAAMQQAAGCVACGRRSMDAACSFVGTQASRLKLWWSRSVVAGVSMRGLGWVLTERSHDQ